MGELISQRRNRSRIFKRSRLRIKLVPLIFELNLRTHFAGCRTRGGPFRNRSFAVDGPSAVSVGVDIGAGFGADIGAARIVQRQQM